MTKFHHNEKEEIQRSQIKGEDIDENENNWMCNGGLDNGFQGGCKGGQKDFAFHETMAGWQCTKCDFDICEHCIRWVMHCDKTKKPLGIVTPDKPELFGTTNDLDETEA